MEEGKRLEIIKDIIENAHKLEKNDPFTKQTLLHNIYEDIRSLGYMSNFLNQGNTQATNPFSFPSAPNNANTLSPVPPVEPQSSAVSDEKPIKIILIGEGGVGKTSWINAISKKAFTEEYTPTKEIVVTNLKFRSESGKVYTVDLWEIPFSLLISCGEIYFIGAAAIQMISLADRKSKVETTWKKQFLRSHGKTFVYCGSKSELAKEERKDRELKSNPYFPLSVKEDKNVMQPINHILKEFTKEQSSFSLVNEETPSSSA